MEPPLQSTARETFTPVRRREATVNTGRLQGAREQEWTTARCFRLLRALTSRVAILKKELSRNNSASQDFEERREASVAKRKQCSGDADWARTRKKIRQTYTSKKKGCSHDENRPGRSQKISSSGRRGSFVPGEVSVPTPILVRAGDERMILVEPSGVNTEHKRKRCKSRFTLEPHEPNLHPVANLCESRYKTTSSRCMTFEGIYNGLDILLRSTAKPAPGSKTLGVGSLLSIVKRVIPQYISQQEGLLLDHTEAIRGKSAIVSRDISVEIYDELEAFGSSGRSWKGLRSVVLSHGLQIIGGAIREGLFNPESCALLVELCMSRSQLDEAESILGAFLDSSTFSEPRTLYDLPDARLLLLWKYTETTDRVAFQYRQLSALITNRALPISWFATKAFSRFWTDLIRHFTDSPINLDAFDFLCTTLPLLAKAQTSIFTGKKDAGIQDTSFAEAIRNTFSSLLTSILSICLLHKDADARCQLGSKKPPDYNKIMVVLLSCSAEYDSSLTALNLPYILILFSALTIASFEADMVLDLQSQVTVRLVTHLQRQKKEPFGKTAIRSGFVQFLSNTARCCGRGASTSGFEFLQELHVLLESLDCDLETGNNLKGVIVDSAYLFSQIVPDHQHLDYATSLDTKFGVRNNVPDGSPEPERSGDTIGGFRWEEGIGEWVTTTPAIVLKRRSAQIYSSDNEDFKDDSPYRPASHLRQAIRERNQLRASICVRTNAFGVPIDDNGDVGDEAPRAEQLSVSESEDELAANLSSDEEVKSSGELVSLESSSEGSVTSVPSSVWTKSRPKWERSRVATRKASRPGRIALQDQNDCQFSDASSPSSTSTISQESEPPESAYKGVNRAPTIGQRAFSSRQAWDLWEDSDDELSFVPTISAVTERVKATPTIDDSRIRPFRLKTAAFRPESLHAFDESEDELCFG